MGKIRRLKDGLRLGSTYTSALVALALLFAIFFNVFSQGASLLSWDLLTSDYASSTYTFSSNADASSFADPKLANASFSSRWGVAFEDETSLTGDSVVSLVYLSPASPVGKLSSQVQVGSYFTKAFLLDAQGNTLIALAKDKASAVAQSFEEGETLTSFSVTSKGGGIRGSLLSTLLAIAVSLLLALPLGIGAAIYLAYFAPKKSKIVAILERMIEITSGIPSIVFGLVGVAVFIPLSSVFTSSSTGSLLSGCFTLVILLLPGIVKEAKEALIEVPSSYRMASLALGASEVQSLHKIILPTALPGLLSAAVLSAGRVIGESAALVYAIGSVIADQVALNSKSATLAVEIWVLLSGENPNFRLASAIAVVILIVISLLSLSAKGLTAIFLKKRGQA